MENTKVINLLKIILKRMRQVQSLDQSKFDVCLDGSLSDVEHYKLEEIFDILYDEHTSLTSLINDVSDLVSSLSKFDVLSD